MALGGGFRRLWTATIASNLGDGLVTAAFPLLAASITRSPTAIAGLSVAAGVPWQCSARSRARSWIGTTGAAG